MQLEDLIEKALSEQRQSNGDREEDLSYLVELQQRTERPTLDRAFELAIADTPDRRRLGLRILAELGPWADRTFKVDAVPFLRRRLREEADEDVLAEAIKALAWQGDPTTVRDVLQYVRDVRHEVRSASIRNLTQYIASPCDEEVLNALIEATVSGISAWGRTSRGRQRSLRLETC